MTTKLTEEQKVQLCKTCKYKNCFMNGLIGRTIICQKEIDMENN